jgi:uncharacterized Zn ribbon protein
MSVVRRALIATLLVVACSPAATLAPPTTPPTAAASPTPAKTPTATLPSSDAGPCAAGSIPAGRIAFTLGNGQANGIGVVNADGSGFHVVVQAKVIEGQPSGGTEAPRWIGPGQILFDSNRNGGPDDWHLFTVDEDGDGAIQLTKGAEGIENHGVLSRDGAFIAFAKYLATGDPSEPFRGGGIFVADPGGRRERQVTATPKGGVDDWPDISPNGRHIAFTREYVGDAGGLFVVNVDGTGLKRLVPADFEPERARWSGDGTMIVFHNNRRRHLEESANVWVINADGSGLRQLTFERVDGQAFYPTWSPDDRFILFVHKPRGVPKNDLAVIPSGGGAMCTLWAGTRASGAWESDWAPAATIVGTWHRKQTCEELMAAFKGAGLLESHRQWADDLCAGTRVATEHSHLFTADGKFGSHDQNGNQVDDGDYTVVGDELRFPSHSKELGQGRDIIVGFRIKGDVVTFDVKVPPGCADPCGTAYFWALSAFASGPWTRIPA